MRIGFIGLGAIGWPLGETLVKAGHDVTVLDLDKDRMTSFADANGCRAAKTGADVGGNEFIVTVLPNGNIVRDAILEAEGGALAGALKPGTIVIDMSSSDPLGTIELGALLKKRGVHLVDAPISKRDTVFGGKSGRPQAGSGALPLVLMVGGEPAAVAKARPVLAAMGDTLIETGGPGSGHAAKTLNNYAAAGAHVALAEAVLIGKRFGLAERKLIEVINVSTGRSFISQLLFSNLLANPSFTAGFSIGLMAKDVKIAADLANAVHMDAPLSRLVTERWEFARDRVGANGDVAQAAPAWDQDLAGK